MLKKKKKKKIQISFVFYATPFLLGHSTEREFRALSREQVSVIIIIMSQFCVNVLFVVVLEY